MMAGSKDAITILNFVSKCKSRYHTLVSIKIILKILKVIFLTIIILLGLSLENKDDEQSANQKVLTTMFSEKTRKV